MGNGRHSKKKAEVRMAREEQEVLKKIFGSLLARSSSSVQLDQRAFSDFFSIPACWAERLFIIADRNRDGYVSYEEFEVFAGVMSFVNEEAISEFMFQLIDMNGDGRISAEDLCLFLANLPLSLGLLADVIDKEPSIRIQWSKIAEGQPTELHIRGCNYETITNQLPLLAEVILEVYAAPDVKDGEHLDMRTFSNWLRHNRVLLDYFYEEMCPEQWTTLDTLEKLMVNKTTPRVEQLQTSFESQSGLLHSPSITMSGLQFDTDRSVTTVFSEEGGLGTSSPTHPRKKGRSTVRSCCACCLSCLHKKIVIPEIFPFEIGYRKKGLIQLNEEGKLLALTAICKYKCLYLLERKQPLELHDVILLRGCYAATAQPIKTGQIMFYGIQITAGEVGSSSSRNYLFYSSSKSEAQEWLQVLQETISREAGTEQWFATYEQIGVGQFSKVYNGTDRRTGHQCAVKIMSKATLNDVERDMLRFELSIVPQVHHPNIVQFTHVIQTAHFAYIIGELVGGGELYALITRLRYISEDQTAQVVYYLLEAIRYLHTCGIVHRDIKPENILVETEVQKGEERITNIKLIDFGLSRVILPNQTLYEQCGTLSYVAPEVLLKYGYGKEVDLWSVGIIMYLMLRGKLPFDSKERMMIIDKTLNAEVDFSDEQWTRISRPAKDLIRRFLDKSPASRITVEEALSHPWIVEKVKLKELKSQLTLYPTISRDDKRKFEELINKVREKLSG